MCKRPGRRGSQPTLAFRSPTLFHRAPQASLELLQAELVVVGMDKDAADLAMRCEHLHLSPLSLLVAKQHTALAAAPACLRRPLPLTAAAAAAVLAELCNAGTGPLCLRLLSLGAPMPGLLERSSHKPSSTHLKRLLPPLCDTTTAADAMLLDAEQYGPETAILCVTNDQGFGETLACCGQFGALTVAGEQGSGM